jgi:hypothetical protein
VYKYVEIYILVYLGNAGQEKVEKPNKNKLCQGDECRLICGAPAPVVGQYTITSSTTAQERNIHHATRPSLSFYTLPC